MSQNSEKVISAEAKKVVETGDNEQITKAIKSAARAKRASKNVSVSREQIELSAHLCKAIGDDAARELAESHFGDDRHFHIAMFTDKAGATAFLLDAATRLQVQSQSNEVEEPADEEPTEKKVPLTNSRRRALLRLLKEERIKVGDLKPMNRAPFDYFVEQGLAVRKGHNIQLTDAGRERARTVDSKKYGSR